MGRLSGFNIWLMPDRESRAGFNLLDFTYKVLCIVMVGLLFGTALALGQTAEGVSTPDQVNAAVGALDKALQGEGGVIAMVGAFSFVFLTLFKYPIFGGLVYKIPPRIRFWVPYVLAGIVGFIRGLESGQSVPLAITYALTSGPMATAIHQANKSVRPKALEPPKPNK